MELNAKNLSEGWCWWCVQVQKTFVSSKRKIKSMGDDSSSKSSLMDFFLPDGWVHLTSSFSVSLIVPHARKTRDHDYCYYYHYHYMLLLAHNQIHERERKKKRMWTSDDFTLHRWTIRRCLALLVCLGWEFNERIRMRIQEITLFLSSLLLGLLGLMMKNGIKK
jgi:hypothetical protein